MKKFKWLNVIKLMILVVSVCVVLHDVYMLSLYSFISGRIASFTWFGVVTFILFLTIAGMIIDDFREQLKSIPSYRPKHARNTNRK